MIKKIILLSSILISSTMIATSVGNVNQYKPFGYDAVKQVYSGANRFKVPHASTYLPGTKNAYFIQTDSETIGWKLSCVNKNGGSKIDTNVIYNIDSVYSVGNYIFTLHKRDAYLHMAKDQSDPKNLTFQKITLPTGGRIDNIAFAPSKTPNLVNIYTFNKDSAGRIQYSTIDVTNGSILHKAELNLTNASDTIADIDYNETKNTVDILINSSNSQIIEQISNSDPKNSVVISTGYGKGFDRIFSNGDNYYVWGGSTAFNGLMYGTDTATGTAIASDVGTVNTVAMFGGKVLVGSETKSLWYLPDNSTTSTPCLYESIWNSISDGYNLSDHDDIVDIPNNYIAQDRLYFSAMITTPTSPYYPDVFLSVQKANNNLALIISLGIVIPLVIIILTTLLIVFRHKIFKPHQKNSFKTIKSDSKTIKAEPVTPKAEPVTPKAEPVTPKAEPVTPKAEPVTPKAEPVTPKAQPVTPKTEVEKIKEQLEMLRKENSALKGKK